MSAATVTHPMAQPWTEWQPMETAPKDGAPFITCRRWRSFDDDGALTGPYLWKHAGIYHFEMRPHHEQCWINEDRTTCIRESYQADYRWAPIPALPPVE